jgi:hypothetical protein
MMLRVSDILAMCVVTVEVCRLSVESGSASDVARLRNAPNANSYQV